MRGRLPARIPARRGKHRGRGNHGSHPRGGRGLLPGGRTAVLVAVDAQHQPGPAARRAAPPPRAARPAAAPPAPAAPPALPHAGMGLQYLCNLLLILFQSFGSLSSLEITIIFIGISSLIFKMIIMTIFLPVCLVTKLYNY